MSNHDAAGNPLQWFLDAIDNVVQGCKRETGNFITKAWQRSVLQIAYEMLYHLKLWQIRRPGFISEAWQKGLYIEVETNVQKTVISSFKRLHGQTSENIT